MKEGRVDVRRLGPEHERAIQTIMRRLGCRTVTDAIRLALLALATEVESGASPVQVRMRAARGSR